MGALLRKAAAREVGRPRYVVTLEAVKHGIKNLAFVEEFVERA